MRRGGVWGGMTTDQTSPDAGRPLPGHGRLHASLHLIPDPRTERRPRHALPDLLFIALCSLLSGGESCVDMEEFALSREDWLRTMIPLAGGPPSHDTFTRVLAALDTHHFEAAVRGWLREIVPPAPHGGPAGRRQLAVDGKTERGSRRGAPGALVMAATVNVWCVEEGLCFGQRRIPEGDGESTQLQLLLRHMDLRGAILSGDAAHCQHDTASAVIARGGDYVLNLKGNQPGAKAEIYPLLEAAAASRPPDWEEAEKGHGRLEIRRCWVLGEVDTLECRGQWSGLGCVALCERESENLVSGKVEKGRRCFLSSLAPDAALIARCVRHHWQVENALHWRLDMLFREDHQRARTGYAATNLSLLRKMALNLLLLEGRRKNLSAKRLRLRAALQPDTLAALVIPLLGGNPNSINA
jgi:predicted transposase YbfD/YdcC